MKRYTLQDLNQATIKRLYNTILSSHKLLNSIETQNAYNKAISTLTLKANKEVLFKAEGELIEISKNY